MSDVKTQVCKSLLKELAVDNKVGPSANTLYANSTVGVIYKEAVILGPISA